MPKKGNHPGEAKVRSSQGKALYGRKRDAFEGPHGKANYIKLLDGEDACLEKERVRSKVT